MKVGGKKQESRNAARKRLYAQLADKSSRNEQQIDGPIVGKIVKVVDEERFGDLRAHEVIVHDGEKAGGSAVPEVSFDDMGHVTVNVHAPEVSRKSRETSAQKRRRQTAAWGRCKAKRETGEHKMATSDVNCRCCGCPRGVTTVA